MFGFSLCNLHGAAPAADCRFSVHFSVRGRRCPYVLLGLFLTASGCPSTDSMYRYREGGKDTLVEGGAEKSPGKRRLSSSHHVSFFISPCHLLPR